MYSIKKYLPALIFSASICLGSCKKWDDHVAIQEQALNVTLTEQISAHANLGKFKSYLEKTGLDKMLSSSKNYSVWAPTDAALATLDAAIVNDTAKLKAYLLNHITGQLFFTRMASDTVRVQMLNGKRVYAYQKKFDEATITEADVYVKNGVLNVIDKGIAPLPSIWQYIQDTKATYKQNAYIAAWTYSIQDSLKAELDSINPVTGEPVYKPNTGIVSANSFLRKVYDVSNEDSLYTYLVLDNSGFDAEFNKQKPYFAAGATAITDTNSAWNVSKDMAIRGLYKLENLPDSLLSKFNVHVPVAKAAIVQTIRVSNGIVYVLNASAARMNEKIPVITVQGEKPVAFSSLEDKYRVKIFVRSRKNPTTQEVFNDIYLNLGSIGVNYFVDYFTTSLYTTKYKVYYTALNDKTLSGQGDDTYGTDSLIKQTFSIGPITDIIFTPTFTATTQVKQYDYTEVLLGEYDNTSHNWIIPSRAALNYSENSILVTPATRRIRLQAPPSVSTGIPNNLTLNYIKFVPVF